MTVFVFVPVSGSTDALPTPTQTENKKMAKPTIKKTATKPAAKATTSTEAPVKQSKGLTLIHKTPSELKDLVGADVPVAVSKSFLVKLIQKQKLAELTMDL